MPFSRHLYQNVSLRSDTSFDDQCACTRGRREEQINSEHEKLDRPKAALAFGVDNRRAIWRDEVLCSIGATRSLTALCRLPVPFWLLLVHGRGGAWKAPAR
jgi:hypothetical protein